MSDRLIRAYLANHEAEVKRRIDNLASNKRHLAMMHEAGRKYKKRHPYGFPGARRF